jgi:hypothetical protein
VDFDGLYMLTDPNNVSPDYTTEDSIELLRTTISNDTASGNLIKLQFVFPGPYYASGFGYFETLTFDFPVGAEATAKGSFVANGGLTFA